MTPNAAAHKTYQLPRTDRAQLATAARELTKPMDREAAELARLRAEVSRLRSELNQTKVAQAAAEAQAEADALAAKEALQEKINRRDRLEAATIKQGGRSYAPQNEVPMLSLMGATHQAKPIGTRKPGLIAKLAFWKR